MQLEFLSRPLKPDLSSAFTNWSHLWQKRFEVYLRSGCQVLSAPLPSLRSSLLPLTLSPFFPLCILFSRCLLLSPSDSPYLVFVSLFVFLAFSFLPSSNSSVRSLLSSYFSPPVPLSWKLTWMDEVAQSCQHRDHMAATGSSKSLWDALSVATLFFPHNLQRKWRHWFPGQVGRDAWWGGWDESACITTLKMRSNRNKHTLTFLIGYSSAHLSFNAATISVLHVRNRSVAVPDSVVCWHTTHTHRWRSSLAPWEVLCTPGITDSISLASPCR